MRQQLQFSTEGQSSEAVQVFLILQSSVVISKDIMQLCTLDATICHQFLIHHHQVLHAPAPAAIHCTPDQNLLMKSESRTLGQIRDIRWLLAATGWLAACITGLLGSDARSWVKSSTAWDIGSLMLSRAFPEPWMINPQVIEVAEQPLGPLKNLGALL